MPKKVRLAPSVWQGVRFPARLLTQEEIDLLSPRCACGLCACVVELQQPLTPELETQPLIEISNEGLAFYCPYHSPIAVSAEQEQRADAEFYEAMKTQVLCFRKSFKHVAVNCLRLQPRCLKKCSHVLRLLNGITPQTAKRIIDTHEAQRQGHDKAAAHPDRPDGQSIPG